MLTENRNTRQRAGLMLSPLVKDTAVIYCGAMVAIASTGLAEPAADSAGLVVKGRAAEYVDNTNGGKRVNIEPGIFCWKNSETHALDISNRIAYVEDDETVGSDPGANGIIAGLIVDIDDEGVWADCRPAAIAAATGANPQAAAVTKPAACAAMTANLTGVDTGTDMTAAQADAVVADLAALKTATDANKAGVDGVIDAMKAAGLMA
jgi:hypothetical protein